MILAKSYEDTLCRLSFDACNGCRDKACLVSTVEYARRGGPLFADFALSVKFKSGRLRGLSQDIKSDSFCYPYDHV